MLFAALVAAVGFAVVEFHSLATLGNLCLGKQTVWRTQLNTVVCTFGYGSGHGADKGVATVGIQRMVARMVGNHHSLKPAALGQTGGSSQHNTVAERHHSAFHIVEVVLTFRYGLGPLEKRRMEVLANETEVDFHQFDTQALAVQARKLQFAHVVVRTVNEVNGQVNAVCVFVEHGHGVHAARQHHQRVFSHIILFYHVIV